MAFVTVGSRCACTSDSFITFGPIVAVSSIGAFFSFVTIRAFQAFLTLDANADLAFLTIISFLAFASFTLIAFLSFTCQTLYAFIAFASLVAIRALGTFSASLSFFAFDCF